MAKSQPPMAFASVARVVGWRVWWRRWFGLARRFLPLLLMVELLIGLKFGGWAALLWVLLPFSCAFAIAVWRRPRHPYAVLALWDQAAGRREDFATAWWVEGLPLASAAQHQHLCSQQERLPAAIKGLARDLPLGWQSRLLLPVVLAAGLELWSQQREQSNAPVEISIEASQRRRLEDELRRAQERLKSEGGESGIKDGERAELVRALSRAEQTLKQAAEGRGRQAMQATEDAARALEKTASQWTKAAGQWASEQLLEALRAQVATADLGDALAARQAEAAAKAAIALAESLKGKSVTDSAPARLAAALREILPRALPEDAQLLAGRPILAAGKAMAETKIDEAAAQFSSLAQAMQQQALQKRGSEALADLAQRLREAGDRPEVGSNSEEQSGKAAAAAGAQNPAENSSASAARMVEAASVPKGQAMTSGQKAEMTEGQQEQGQAQAMVTERGDQGEPPPKSDGPKVFAPVPGLDPEQSRQAMLIDAPPGAQGKVNAEMSGEAGRRVGANSVALAAQDPAEQAAQAALSALVQAQASAQGESFKRQVQGGVKAGESATLTGSAKAAAEAINAQERALDEAVLPSNRREQIRRYFQQLRERLEAASP